MARIVHISNINPCYKSTLDSGTDIKLDSCSPWKHMAIEQGEIKKEHNWNHIKPFSIFQITVETLCIHKQMISDNIFYYHAPSSRSLSAFCPLTASIQPYLPRPYIPLFPRFILFPFSSISLTFRFVFFSNRRKTVHIQCVPHLITFHT